MGVSNTTPTAINGITDFRKVRVLVYSSNQLVHVPLGAITGPLADRIKILEEKLESK